MRNKQEEQKGERKTSKGKSGERERERKKKNGRRSNGSSTGTNAASKKNIQNVAVAGDMEAVISVI